MIQKPLFPSRMSWQDLGMHQGKILCWDHASFCQGFWSWKIMKDLGKILALSWCDLAKLFTWTCKDLGVIIPRCLDGPARFRKDTQDVKWSWQDHARFWPSLSMIKVKILEGTCQWYFRIMPSWVVFFACDWWKFLFKIYLESK